MCEIEHFVDPNDKNHHKFGRVKDYQVLFFSACNQLAGKPAEWIAVGKAVEDVNLRQRYYFMVVVLGYCC